MTRGRIIALVIVCAAACVVLVGDPRYRPLTPGEVQSHGVVPLSWPDSIDQKAVADRVRQSVRTKRYSFLPGRQYVFFAEGCPLCVDGRHGVCQGQYVFFVRGVGITSVRCTCPHPSHAQESE